MYSQHFFRGFDRTRNLQLNIQQEITTMIERFFPKKKFNIVTRVHTTRAREDKRHQKYLLEVQVTSPRFNTPIFIKKEGKSVGKLIQMISHNLERLIVRHLDKNQGR